MSSRPTLTDVLENLSGRLRDHVNCPFCDANSPGPSLESRDHREGCPLPDLREVEATLSRAGAQPVAWGKDLPSAPGHYLFVDDNAFTLFDAYPTVAAKPLEAARSYEVTIAATGPRVTTYRAGVHDTFDAQLLGPGVWYGPLPEPAGPLHPPAGGA